MPGYFKISTTIAALALLTGCSSQKNEQANNSASAVSSGPAAANFAPRIGIAVRTESRTCAAIRNANLGAGTSVALVSPALPQTVTSAEISSTSSAACPISKDVDPAVTNYELKIPAVESLPKLTPFVVVTAQSTAFTVDNNLVKIDLAQDGQSEMFRSCSSDDGIHLSAWVGKPLSGTMVWSGHYYESSNPGVGAVCTPKELTGI